MCTQCVAAGATYAVPSLLVLRAWSRWRRGGPAADGQGEAAASQGVTGSDPTPVGAPPH